MVTTSELKEMLLKLGCVPQEDGKYWKVDSETVLPYAEACKIVLDRCTCCGEKGIGRPSAACFARHEAKDCNCFRNDS